MVWGMVRKDVLDHEISASIRTLWPTILQIPCWPPFLMLNYTSNGHGFFLKRTGGETTKYIRHNIAGLQSMAQVQK